MESDWPPLGGVVLPPECIAWNFQGRPLGLGATVASLVVIGISLVILRPQPTEPVLYLLVSTKPLMVAST